MSAISVVRYHHHHHHHNVLQQNNQNVRKASPDGDVKPASLHPKDILLTNPARKKSTKHAPKLTNPAPVAVARRNARERNRVKQVNNGFATLRQHIPTAIAAAFENCNGRGGSKKLSKVETLRMAVEYIRLLEDMLSGEHDLMATASSNSSYNSLSTSSPSSTSSSTITSSISSSSSNPSTPDSAAATAANMFASYPSDDLLVTQVRASPSQRPYQISLNSFYSDENVAPLDDDDDILSNSLIDADLDLNKEMLLNSMQSTETLSPDFYRDDSMSPISLEPCVQPASSIKSEPLEEDSKENMIQTIQWWESQVGQRCS